MIKATSASKTSPNRPSPRHCRINVISAASVLTCTNYSAPIFICLWRYPHLISASPQRQMGHESSPAWSMLPAKRWTTSNGQHVAVEPFTTMTYRTGEAQQLPPSPKDMNLSAWAAARRSVRKIAVKRRCASDFRQNPVLDRCWSPNRCSSDTTPVRSGAKAGDVALSAAQVRSARLLAVKVEIKASKSSSPKGVARKHARWTALPITTSWTRPEVDVEEVKTGPTASVWTWHLNVPAWTKCWILGRLPQPAATGYRIHPSHLATVNVHSVVMKELDAQRIAHCNDHGKPSNWSKTAKSTWNLPSPSASSWRTGFQASSVRSHNKRNRAKIMSPNL